MHYLVVVTSIKKQSIWILLPHLLNHTKCQSQEEIIFFLLSECRRPCGKLHHSSLLMPYSPPAMELLNKIYEKIIPIIRNLKSLNLSYMKSGHIHPIHFFHSL